MSRKILVVDDDPKIRELLFDILKENNFQVALAATTEEGWDQVNQFKPDLIILDLEIPLKGGLEFCRELKQSASHVQIPVIFLTVRAQDIDKIIAFSLGGDDFVTKPFSYKELLARIQVALRRSGQMRDNDHILESGTLAIDFDRRSLQISKKEVRLTPKEFEVLRVLYENRHRVVEDKELFETVWGSNSSSLMSTLYTHINRIRSKLQDHGKKVKTISGSGFRFDERQETD